MRIKAVAFKEAVRFLDGRVENSLNADGSHEKRAYQIEYDGDASFLYVHHLQREGTLAIPLENIKWIQLAAGEHVEMSGGTDAMPRIKAGPGRPRKIVPTNEPS